jgi:hypothetical protein
MPRRSRPEGDLRKEAADAPTRHPTPRPASSRRLVRRRRAFPMRVLPRHLLQLHLFQLCVSQRRVTQVREFQIREILACESPVFPCPALGEEPT